VRVRIELGNSRVLKHTAVNSERVSLPSERGDSSNRSGSLASQVRRVLMSLLIRHVLHDDETETDVALKRKSAK
jgi:hypothetical protein